MNALDRVRKKFGYLPSVTDKTDTSPSVGSVGSSPRQSKDSLPSDLDRRIRTMAQRWHYTEVEINELLDLARANSCGWLHALALDEAREAEFRERGLVDWRDA